MGYHLVNRRVISIPTDVQHVYRCPKRTFILHPKTSCFSFKDIRRNKFDSCLKKGNTRLRPFIGAATKQMETYVKPIIQDVTPDVVILNIWCNEISNKNMSVNDIAEGIINIGRYCKEHNVNITISSLICRSQRHIQHKMNAVKTMLMNRCKTYGLG